MSLPLPRLDDRNWQDLRDEGVSLIPRYAPDWTDHNLSDPGITLIELLAYHAELAIFRLDQIGDPHRRAFLRLLGEKHLPAGPRPAATLLEFAPDSNHLPGQVDAKIAAGSYFVPRQSPKAPGRSQRERKVLGMGEWNVPPRLRSAGEPDEPLLRADAADDEQPVPEFGFRAAHVLDLTGIQLVAVQSFDGRDYRDITNVLARLNPAPVWGAEPMTDDDAPPEKQPALYLGLNLDWFDASRFSPDDSEGCGLTLWCVPDGFEPHEFSASSADSIEVQRCSSAPPPPGDPVPTRSHAVVVYDAKQQSSAHHGLEVRWEYWLNEAWLGVPDSAPFRDETRGFSRPGRVVFPIGIFAPTAEKQILGAVPAKHFYVRCRLTKGRPDAAPLVCGLFADAVLVEQWDRTATPFTPTPSQPVDAREPVPPESLHYLRMTEEATADVDDAANDLTARGWAPSVAAWGAWPLWGEYGFDVSDPTSNPELERDPMSNSPRIRAVVVGVGTGDPNQAFALPCPPDNTQFKPESPDAEDDGPIVRVMTDQLAVWTLEPPWGWMPNASSGLPQPKWQSRRWSQVSDLAQSARKSASFRYDAAPTAASGQSRFAAPGRIVFGDGENGRVPPPGSLVLASYAWTYAEGANFSAGFLWARATDRDRDHLEQVKRFPTIRFRNPLAAAGGRDAEPLSDALRRLAEEFAAPEDLIERADSIGGNTLDGIDVADVPAPPMAVNLLDLECLARNVPGTEVARARAWPEVDSRFPGYTAPGAVTLVIVPTLPGARPMPTEGLVARVRAFLWERRPIACRLSVTGPEYIPIRVKAVLHTTPGKKESVFRAADAAVRKFLHPLDGGAANAGWPFGRDVHTGELMRILAGITDVRHVTGLRLAGAEDDWNETAVGVPARSLVELTELSLDVREDA